MPKVHAVEAELTKASKVKPGAKEKRQTFLKRLHSAVSDEDEFSKEQWDSLSLAAQEWANACTEAEGDLPEFDEVKYSGKEKAAAKPEQTDIEDAIDEAAAKSEDSDKEEKVSTKKAAKAAKSKKAAPEKETKAAAPAKQAAKKSNGRAVGERGISEPWRKALALLGKAGPKGMTLADFSKAAEKVGANQYFARFIRNGMITRLERGVFALTAAGSKAIKE